MTRNWRDSAACRDMAPMFDVYIDGETEQQRTGRHTAARAICNHECPVKADCKAEFDPLLDGGVRFGYVIGLSRNVPAGGGRGRVGKEMKPIKHGTATGYRIHLRRQEQPCQQCRIAESEYRQDRKAKAS